MEVNKTVLLEGQMQFQNCESKKTDWMKYFSKRLQSLKQENIKILLKELEECLKENTINDDEKQLLMELKSLLLRQVTLVMDSNFTWKPSFYWDSHVAQAKEANKRQK